MTLTNRQVLTVGRIIWRGIIQTPHDDPKCVEIDLTEEFKSLRDSTNLGKLLKYALHSGRIEDVDGPPFKPDDKVMEIS